LQNQKPTAVLDEGSEMSGFFILFVACVLFDEALPAPIPKPAASEQSGRSGENLPAPKKPSPVMETTKLISSTTQTPPSAPAGNGVPTEEAKIGWGVDPSDNSMYMVIQIAPSAIETFAAGQRGQELSSRIPPALRNRIDKVIVRFGTGPVEQFPAESELATMPLSRNTNPQITNLDRRTLVNIDPPRDAEVVPTSSTAQIPLAPGANVPGTLSSPPTTTTPPPVWNNNVPSTRPTASSPSDGFSAANRVVPQSLLPFGGSRPSTPNTPGTGSQGNVTYSGTNFSGNNYGNVPYPPSSFGNNVPMVATNPTSGIYPPVNEPIMPGGTNGNHNTMPPSTSPNFYNPNAQAQANANYGLPVSSSNPTYATGGTVAPTQAPYGQGPLLPPPNLLPSTLPNPSNGSTFRLPTREEHEEAEDVLNSTRPGSWVPFFLVLSFILNVYFGLWLNHLSTKYRHLLANMRGVSLPELERA
jgi:hypothetical protein